MLADELCVDTPSPASDEDVSEFDGASSPVAVKSPFGVVKCGVCVSMAAVGLFKGLTASLWLGKSLSTPLIIAVSLAAVVPLGGLIPSLWLGEPPSSSPATAVSVADVGLLRGLVASPVVSMSAEALAEASDELAPWSWLFSESAVGDAAFCAAVTACWGTALAVVFEYGVGTSRVASDVIRRGGSYRPSRPRRLRKSQWKRPKSSSTNHSTYQFSNCGSICLI